MSSQGPLYPSTVVDDSSVGGTTWSNPSNAATSNDSYATATFPGGAGGLSHYLKATGYGFSIPSGATIDGIIVHIERKANASSRVRDDMVKIVKGGTIGSTDLSADAFWTTSDQTVDFGNSTQLWGESWTYSDINDSTFGFVMAAFGALSKIGSVDAMGITVYYTESGGGDVEVSPDPATWVMASVTPTILNHENVSPSAISWVMASVAPSVIATDHVWVEPSASTWVMASVDPDVSVTEHVWVTPSASTWVLTTVAPTILNHTTVEPDVATWVMATIDPDVLADIYIEPSPATWVLATSGCSVIVGDSGSIVVILSGQRRRRVN